MNKLRQTDGRKKSEDRGRGKCGRHAQMKRPLYIRAWQSKKEGILLANWWNNAENFAFAIGGEIMKMRDEISGRKKET